MEDKSIKVRTNIGSPLVSGHVGGNVSNDVKDSFNNYTSEQKQSLAEAAAEIQQLLEQLEKSYSTDTTAAKMTVATEAIKQIDSNPTLTNRILSALKAGSVQALGQALNHPAATFAISALEDWYKSKGS